jgi:hypothetical protein
MSKQLSIFEVNQKLKYSNRIIEGEYYGFEYDCKVKCINCGNIRNYKTFNNAMRGKCHICNDVKAHRGNQTIEKFNKKIFSYGWVVDGKYNGSHNPCSFKCLKCGETQLIQFAKSIRNSKCKNCINNTCLICNNIFHADNNVGYKTSRAFCYECLPSKTTKSKGRYAYNKLYNLYILNKIKEIYGTQCSKCGYKKCYEALDFHHKNINEKEYAPARIIRSHKKLSEILKELNKCILLCSNCHRELHANERNK